MVSTGVEEDMLELMPSRSKISAAYFCWERNIPEDVWETTMPRK
jgi:hypothetical protein